ncbi:SDR family NAD(P)-dependent oxidoreductase [Nocardioides sp. NPDC101246]|uniref:SDR family NAD(P)-dependent oxidoreductase n=1 Tax=Nocardioides sp. NPDC101246 TaxID=3364336 RepID=UPI0037F51A49
MVSLFSLSLSLLQTPRARMARTIRAVTGGPSPLAGRTVLVTGASSGIGEATSYAAARRGAHVLLAARRAEELERVRKTIEDAGGQASTYLVDMADGDSIDALVEQLLAEHGAVDYLVNNAGRSIRRSLELTYDRFSRLSAESEERAGRREASIMHDFERMMAVNYFGAVRLTMGLLPAMRAQRFGHVVNIVTWGNQIKAPKFAAYIAAKSALDVFGRILSREAYFENVTCTNMRVAIVRTPMIAPTAEYEGRGESPEECAERVVRALEDRPVTVDGAFGSVFEVLNILTPRLADLAMAASHLRTPDSAAARGAAQVRD